MRTLEFGVLFRGVAIVAAMRFHQSGSGKRSFATLGIASCALSYLYFHIRDHYDFVLYYTYGVLPNIPLVNGGVYSAV